MVKNKGALIGSAVILCICMSLFFPFPDNKMIHARTTFMSFPISGYDGYNVLGIIGSFLFIFAMILLVRGLNKYHFQTVVIALIVYTLLPLLLISMYQETLADGIAAISYDGKGTCDYERVSKEVLNGECKLLFHNRSGETVSFQIEFLDSFFMKKDTRLTSPMNVNGPYSISIEANSEKSIQLKELLDLSGVPNHIDGGSSMYINIKLIDGESTRIL
ncbi:hypothetical protein ACQKFO_19510 [Rossellomorea sp. NPDC071047]|uniref:hypothetical protein n=1 Tax=Rossellomorea sp. NPDC071047 TaxID=3390675 RepID=UPI003CFEA606